LAILKNLPYLPVAGSYSGMYFQIITGYGITIVFAQSAFSPDPDEPPVVLANRIYAVSRKPLVISQMNKTDIPVNSSRVLYSEKYK
jgi:hypothetical protein